MMHSDSAASTRVSPKTEAAAIIAKAIRKTESFDPRILCSYICTMLEEVYGEDLDERSTEIGMATTGEIISSVQAYINQKYAHEITPQTSLSDEVKLIFGRAHERVGEWNKQKLCMEVKKILAETYAEKSLAYKSIRLGLFDDERISRLLDLYQYETNKKESFSKVCSLIF